MKTKAFWILIFAVVTLFHGLARADEKKILKVGFGCEKPPYVLEREQSGLEVELIREAMSAAGYQVDPIFAPLARLKAMLQAGKLDAVTIANNHEPLKFFYSDPYLDYHNYAIALQKKNLKIKTISDLKHFSVTSFQGASDLLGAEFAKMAAENSQYREFADQQLKSLQLFHERFDVAIADKRIFNYFTAQLQKDGEPIPPLEWFDIFPVNHYSAAFRSEELAKEFNTGLALIRKNGTYKKLEKKYQQIQ